MRHARPPYQAFLEEGGSRHSSPSRRGRSSRLSSMRMAALGASLSLAMLLIFVTWRGGSAQQAPASLASAEDMQHFVRVSGGQFVVNCKSFLVAGWNQWEAVEAGAGSLELFGASLPPSTTGPALVRRLLDRAVANGFSVVRAWAHTVTPQYAMQTAPGQYTEAIFQGLDYLLDEARQRGIRVLLSLTDNWQQTGGADEFVRWAGAGLTHEDFFTDPRARSLYKAHVAAVLGRVNSISGRRYSQDPTIFAWGLINEPRCYQCGTAIQQWIEEMAAYVKSLDKNHLLTVGEEGFYPAGSPQAAANPQGIGSWATDEGQSFVADHSSPDIDFMAFHLWINNWEDRTPDFAQRWIQQHIADAQALGKPLLLEEFGVWDGDREERNLYYRLILNEVQKSAQAGGPLKGALFWTWYAEGQRAPAEEGGSAAGLFGVFESDTQNWPVIQGFAQAMRRLATTGAPAAGCAAEQAAALPRLPDCSATRVGGKAGTGLEGPTCSTDINECARGTAGCHPNAACTNSNGGYACKCFPGCTGDGVVSCVPDPAVLAAVQARYTSQGPAKLACSEGRDVPYPEGAPGFQYDLTGGLARKRGGEQQAAFGSRTAVEPLQCMQACDSAPTCDSFSYNPTRKLCFLKAGPARQTCQAVPTVCVSARGQPYSCGAYQTYFRAGAAAAGAPTAAAAGGGRGGGSGSGGGAPPGGGTVALLPPEAQAASVQLVEAFQAP